MIPKFNFEIKHMIKLVIKRKSFKKKRLTKVFIFVTYVQCAYDIFKRHALQTWFDFGSILTLIALYVDDSCDLPWLHYVLNNI